MNDDHSFDDLKFEEIGDEPSSGNTDKRFFKQTKKKKSLFERLMYDNRFVLLVAVICALGIWFYVSLYAGDEVTRTIADIPITIKVEDSTPGNLGLELFGETDFKTNVVIKGPRYKISESAFSIESLSCYANTNYVNSSGVATLDVVVSTNVADVSIESYSTSSVTVYFDKRVEKEIPVEANIKCEAENLAADGYMTDTPITSMSKVNLSGPASEIDKIEKILATAVCEGNLTENFTADAELSTVMTVNSECKYTTIDEDITVTVPVRKIMQLPTSIAFASTPTYFTTNPLEYTISPSTISCAVLAKDADTATSVQVGVIDFNQLDNSVNTFTFDKSSVSDILILDETQEFTVKVDTSDYVTKEIEITPTSENVQISGAPENMTITPDDKSITVTIIGPEDELENVDASAFYVEVNLKDIEIHSGRFRAECSIRTKSGGSCWAYGEYTVFLKAD